MPRLVDADDLEKRLHEMALNEWNQGTTTSWSNAFLECEDMVYDAPTVDAEPVRHGHWIIEDIVTYERSYGGTLYEPVYKCSCCGRVTESYVRGDEPIMPEDADFPEFCGNCGAKMDEVTDGNDAGL